MTNEVLSGILAAEQEAGDIVAEAQAAARTAILLSQKNLESKTKAKISEATRQAKQLILQKKEFLNIQADLLKQENQAKYQELFAKAALKMEDAADFIAERIK